MQYINKKYIYLHNFNMNPNYLSSQNMMNMQNMMNNPVMMSMFIQWMNNQNMQGMNMDMNMIISNQIMMNMFYQWLNSQNINQNQNQNNTFINNQQPQSNQNNNIGAINLMFSKDMKNYPIVTNYNESLGTVIGKYINLTKDYNINMYIYNGKRLNESLTVGEAGLIGGSVIIVTPTQNILGAF